MLDIAVAFDLPGNTGIAAFYIADDRKIISCYQVVGQSNIAFDPRTAEKRVLRAYIAYYQICSMDGRTSFHITEKLAVDKNIVVSFDISRDSHGFGYTGTVGRGF